MTNIRKAAVSGSFYPSNANELQGLVQAYLDNADAADIVPKALIVPHAGYVYSGKIAGMAYVLVRKMSAKIKRVVLVGPAHHAYVSGMAISEADCFETPLGQVAVDKEAVEQILLFPSVYCSDEPHFLEHCLEVQLPFLQELFREIKIVPILAGMIDPDKLAEVLKALVDDQTLIIVSADLSHFLDYDEANDVDGQTSKAILELSFSDIADMQSCGAVPIRGLLYYAKELGFKVEKIVQANSGDVSGDKSRVVGYGAYVFY